MILRVKNVLGKAIRLLYKLTYRMIPCDEKTILFISFHGRGYSDNPKALHEYMCAHPEYQGYRCIWAIKHHKQKQLVIPHAKVIEYFSLSYFYYLARSKYWFVNCKLPAYVLKKKQQVYLQTWHGTPLKKLAHDIDVKEGTTFYRSRMSAEQMRATYDDDVKKYNYMISPNPFCTEVFQSAFRISKEKLIETGYPRNDVLCHISEQEMIDCKQALGLPLDKKVILYAPTWRDNSFVSSGYTFTLQVDFQKWKEVLGEEYVVLFKPHYLIINHFDMKEYEGFVYTVDAQKDISMLYILSDVLVTDYSSVFFDYAILGRPMYFYMFDLQEYAEELRGFYFDIHKTLPGEIVEREEDLLVKLKENRYDYESLTQFNEEFNAWHDGCCAQKVLSIVLDGKGVTQ